MSETSDSPVPLLSLVIPTTGKVKLIDRVLISFVNNSPRELIDNTELILFINNTDIEIKNIEQMISDQFASIFLEMRVIRTDKYYKTAEESAYSASAFARGAYILVCGDKRIFLPDGLNRLYSYIKNGADCVFFNSYWADMRGKTSVVPSMHMKQLVEVVPYKLLVMSLGVNFYATSFGAFVLKRDLFDLPLWKHLIESCAPHFSHVIAYMIMLRDRNVIVDSTFLFVLESKPYHAGDFTEWDDYAERAKVYRFFPWSLGLVRLFQYAVNSGVLSYQEIRASVCSEAKVLRRQVDEIYTATLNQIARAAELGFR